METTRIQNGQTERIEVLALDSSGSPVTGLGNVLLDIRRISDGFWLDFNDNTFKNSGWTTRQKVMTEIDATNDAGKYKYDFNTTGFNDNTYEMRTESAGAANFPQFGELKVGDYVDNLDVTISSRGSQSDVTAIKTKTDNHPADLAAELTIVKGLLGVNCVLDDFTYDGNGKATAGNLYVYNSVANANNHDKSTGLLKKIVGVAVISGGNTTKLTRTEG